MNNINELYQNIEKDINIQLELITNECKKDYDKLNQDFKNRNGISIDKYYEKMAKFYEEI